MKSGPAFLYVRSCFLYVGLWEEVADERAPERHIRRITVPPKGGYNYLSAIDDYTLSDNSVLQAFCMLARILLSFSP